MYTKKPIARRLKPKEMQKKINYKSKKKKMELTALNALESGFPFSDSLNNLILKAYNSLFIKRGEYSKLTIHFVPTEPYKDFEAMKQDIERNERLYISTLHCDNTIFGNPLINQMFRAVHDILHYQYSLDFSYESECLVNYYQNIAFKAYGARQYDLDLLNIETVGQIVYHKTVGCFPENQRTFTYLELKKLGY